MSPERCCPQGGAVLGRMSCAGPEQPVLLTQPRPRRVSCLGGTRGGHGGSRAGGRFPSRGATEAPVGPPGWAVGQAGLREQPCGSPHVLPVPLPTPARARGHRGVPVEEAPGPEREGVPGLAGGRKRD